MSTQSIKGVYYANKRYITFAIVTIVSLLIPFIKNGENHHLFLLSFDKKQLHLLFTSFDMQEMYLMPFLLIMLFLGIFFLTTLGGRVWCGWTCPQTIFRVIYRDLIQTKLLGIRKSIKNKQKEPTGNMFKRFIGAIIWTILALVAASNFLWYFVPPEDFFEYIKNPSEHMVLIGFVLCVAAFLVYDVILLKENFCVYVCPYARVQSVMFDDDTIQTIYNPNRGGVIYDESGKKLWKKPKGENDECTGCEACVRVCPTHIDIRKGMQLECINCLECADACTKVMNALKKPTLISWSSEKEAIEGKKTNYFRFRTMAYMVALCIAFGLLIFMGGKKEYMLLNINRTTELYNIKDSGKTVENAYTFLFQNTSDKDHKYYFEIDNQDIKIIRPKKPFLLKAGQKAKKIVVLRTHEKLADNSRGDVPVPIVVTSYAIDDKAKIIVKRPTIFGYPSQENIDKKRKQ